MSISAEKMELYIYTVASAVLPQNRQYLCCDKEQLKYMNSQGDDVDAWKPVISADYHDAEIKRLQDELRMVRESHVRQEQLNHSAWEREKGLTVDRDRWKLMAEELAGALKDIESGAVYRDRKPGKTPKTRARIALEKFDKMREGKW